jgi:hypothetical protein
VTKILILFVRILAMYVTVRLQYRQRVPKKSDLNFIFLSRMLEGAYLLAINGAVADQVIEIPQCHSTVEASQGYSLIAVCSCVCVCGREGGRGVDGDGRQD